MNYNLGEVMMFFQGVFFGRALSEGYCVLVAWRSLSKGLPNRLRCLPSDILAFGDKLLALNLQLCRFLASAGEIGSYLGKPFHGGACS